MFDLFKVQIIVEVFVGFLVLCGYGYASREVWANLTFVGVPMAFDDFFIGGVANSPCFHLFNPPYALSFVGLSASVGSSWLRAYISP